MEPKEFEYPLTNPVGIRGLSVIKKWNSKEEVEKVLQETIPFTPNRISNISGLPEWSGVCNGIDFIIRFNKQLGWFQVVSKTQKDARSVADNIYRKIEEKYPGVISAVANLWETTNKEVRNLT